MGRVCLTKQKLSLVLVALFILLAGCSPKTPMPTPPLERIQDKGLLELNRGIRHQYPNRFKAVHHVALTLFGKTYVLNGYLSVNRLERQIHLIAQNDMGGTLFEIHTQRGETIIQSKTKFLKTSWLEKSVLKDLENLYLPPPLASPTLSQGHNNLFLLSENQEGICREFLFKKKSSHQNYHQQNNYKLMGYRQVKNRKEIYAITYGYDEKNNEQYPSFIAIENHTLHYQLEINIQYYFPPKGTAETKD